MTRRARNKIFLPLKDTNKVMGKGKGPADKRFMDKMASPEKKMERSRGLEREKKKNAKETCRENQSVT